MFFQGHDVHTVPHQALAWSQFCCCHRASPVHIFRSAELADLRHSTIDKIYVSGITSSNRDMGLAHPEDAYQLAMWRGRHKAMHDHAKMCQLPLSQASVTCSLHPTCFPCRFPRCCQAARRNTLSVLCMQLQCGSACIGNPAGPGQAWEKQRPPSRWYCKG